MRKPKICKICKNKFTPVRDMQPTCKEMDCMVAYADKALKKSALNKKKIANKEKKDLKLKDKTYLKNMAQKYFNLFIRLRDAELPCISCGYDGNNRQWHASHFKPATNSKLRFNEDNVHKSCSICNTHLSGNLAEYRIKLIDKIGLEKVEYLESVEPIYRYSEEELLDIWGKYKRKAKELKDLTI